MSAVAGGKAASQKTVLIIPSTPLEVIIFYVHSSLHPSAHHSRNQSVSGATAMKISETRACMATSGATVNDERNPIPTDGPSRGTELSVHHLKPFEYLPAWYGSAALVVESVQGMSSGVRGGKISRVKAINSSMNLSRWRKLTRLWHLGFSKRRNLLPLYEVWSNTSSVGHVHDAACAYPIIGWRGWGSKIMRGKAMTPKRCTTKLSTFYLQARARMESSHTDTCNPSTCAAAGNPSGL